MVYYHPGPQRGIVKEDIQMKAKLETNQNGIVLEAEDEKEWEQVRKLWVYGVETEAIDSENKVFIIAPRPCPRHSD